VSAERVVLVHGIWMHGAVMVPLKHRLERVHGYEAHTFTWPSVRGTLAENTDLLADFLVGLGPAPLHLVGHSLGGVLILNLLAQGDALPPGRVVCLGSPLCGSRAAASLRTHRWGVPVLGNTITGCVLEDTASRWARAVAESREIGVIAGTRPLGVGRWITTFDEPCDGTVAVSETRLPGAADHIELPVTHMGMLLSRRVADQTAAFLRQGRFAR
jgi:pimeloyl-ACP methyl ester carboxylesterase